MTGVNWGLAGTAQHGFQNALSMGMQMGAQARQAKEARERKNALSAFVLDPNEANTAAVAPYAPELVLQQRQQQAKIDADRQKGELVQRVLGGDDAALTELARIDLPTWKSLREDQRTEAKQEAEIYGNAALDVLQRPLEQRAAAIMQYAEQLGKPEIARIAQLPPEQQEAALRSAVVEAQMIGKLHEMERPSYMAIPQGGTLVDTKNPAAVQQFGQESAYADGTVIENDKGERLVRRGGQWVPMGGAASNGSGGFPGS